MLRELIGTIIGVIIIFWVGLEIGSIVGRASTLIDIKGTDDVLESLKQIKKNNDKKINMLQDYNNDIIKKIDDLLNR